MSQTSTQQPIFIHSLFRSGSTWLFDRFRHADGAGYWCYQEPYHEMLDHLRDQPDMILGIHGEMNASMRHPELDKPYFYEFHAVREHIADSFHKCISFTSFFDTSICPAFDDYTARLIRHAQARAVLQCCRSFGRVAHLRRQHGGLHLHLWRNPWDQWWSYQVDEYFDTTNLAIIRAHNPPQVVALLRGELGLDSAASSEQGQNFSLLRQHPLSTEERYLAFYVLWLYSLIENKPQADLDINIDRLASEPSYRQDVEHALVEHGVTGLDLSTCAVPQAQYDPDERAFFAGIEGRAHRLFAMAGYSISALHDAIQLQAAHQPQPTPQISALMRDAQHGRDAALRFANQNAATAHQLQQATARAEHAEHQHAEDQTKNEWLNNAWQAAQTRVDELNHANHHWKATADQLRAELHRVYASRSWRLTWPLRKAMAVAKRIVQRSKNRLKSILLHTIRTALLHPAAKTSAFRVLNRMPRLKQRLRSIAINNGLPISTHGNGAARANDEYATRPPSEQSQCPGAALTPRAQHIYKALQQLKKSS